jgi:hypothetical protein
MLHKIVGIGLTGVVSVSSISSGAVKAEDTQCYNVQNSVIVEILNQTGYKYPDIVDENFNPLRIAKLDDGKIIWSFALSTYSSRTDNVINSPELISGWAQRIGKACPQIISVVFGVTRGNWQTWFNRKENFTYPHTRFDDHTDNQH